MWPGHARLRLHASRRALTTRVSSCATPTCCAQREVRDAELEALREQAKQLPSKVGKIALMQAAMEGDEESDDDHKCGSGRVRSLTISERASLFD